MNQYLLLILLTLSLGIAICSILNLVAFSSSQYKLRGLADTDCSGHRILVDGQCECEEGCPYVCLVIT